MLTTSDKLIITSIVLGLVLGLIFIVNWLFTMGIIWVLSGFGVDCSDKFQHIFVGLILFQCLTGGLKISKK